MLIKVCGLREKENILAIDALRPDLLGLIFHKSSPRYVGENIIPETVTSKVGVFVNWEMDEIIRKAEMHNLRYIQLHGSEDVETAKELSLQGFKVIKVFQMENEIDNNRMADFAPFCHYFLFDTKGANEGGNGIKFNWSLLENYQLSIPFLLSGGIAPEDVEFIKAIQQPLFTGVDINSRFESEPGIKNITALKMFIDEIRN